MGKEKQEYITYRINRSDETYADALLLAENHRWNSCVNRLYYSAFFLITALLFVFDLNAETHNGVKTQFFMKFIKTGQLPKESGKLYSNLFDWRQESDYADFVDFDEQTVELPATKTGELNKRLKDFILKNIDKPISL